MLDEARKWAKTDQATPHLTEILREIDEICSEADLEVEDYKSFCKSEFELLELMSEFNESAK